MNKSFTTISPFYFIIFGGDGDLSRRKIIPALFHRWFDKQLEMPFEILCISRSSDDKKEFTDQITPFIEASSDKVKFTQKDITTFFKKVTLLHIPKNDVKTYEELTNSINKNPDWQRAYYLSVPSGAFSEICDALKASQLINKKSKVVLEKPLGHDLKSSKKINDTISAAFDESQIFRIDHYLGKETVQNLMVLRFANPIFENAWNGDKIDNVQITVSESLGVEKRAGYYDKTGALLDMVQNHLLQLLCLVAMEPPSHLDPNSVRNEKLKILESLRMLTKSTIGDNVVRGQYSRGKLGEEKLNSYLEDIDTYESDTETFVAMKVFIDNWRWSDTPFYLRTGKRMKKRYSEIVINFKPAKHNIFPDSEYASVNTLIIRLQPEERIELVQMSKIPGPGGYRYRPVSLGLDFIDSFKDRMPEAYERLIIDILRGNQTLFMRYDELGAAWSWIESIKNNWEEETKLVLYESGSWGPGDSIMDDNHNWELKDR